MGKNINDLSGKVGLDVTDFKAGTSELNRSIRLVESEFKAIAAGMDDWKGSSEGLEARVKALNDIIDLQKQKVANLQNEHDKIAAEYGESSKAAQDLQIKINRANEELNKNEKELRDCTSALDKMGDEEAQAGKQAEKMGVDLKGAEKQTDTFKSSIKDFARSSVGQFATVAGATRILKALFEEVKQLWEDIKESAAWADTLNTLSVKTGIATETLQKLEYASKFVDVEMSVMEKGVAKVITALGEAQTKGEDYIKIADGITVSMHNVSGQVKTSEQLFYNTVDALGAMSDATSREVAAQEIFGRSYQDIMPLIEAGTGALEEYGDEAESLGVVLDTVTIAALQRLQDEIDQTGSVIDAQKKEFSAILASYGITATQLEQKTANLIQKIGVGLKRGGQATRLFFQGYSTAEMEGMITAAEDLNVAAYAAGLTLDEYTQKLSDMTYYLTVNADGTKTWAEINEEATANVIAGIDAATLAEQQLKDMTQQLEAEQANWDAQVSAAAANYVALAEQYTSEVAALTSTYMQQMGGMFDAFPEKAEVSMYDLLGNLNSQIGGFRQWSNDIEALAKRGIDEGLLQELRDMGPEAAGEIEALAGATDTQLEAYVTAWKTKTQLANDAAVEALEPLAGEVDAALQEVENVIAAKDEAMKELGRELANGLGEGINQNAWFVKQAAANAVQDAIDAAKAAAGINSPSAVMRDVVGIPLGEGAGIGMIEGLQAMIPRIQDGLLAMTDQLASGLSSGAVYNTSTTNTYNQSYQINTSRPVGLREIRQFQIEDEQRRALES